jgi:uncharacterized protein (TIGR02594 family)
MTKAESLIAEATKWVGIREQGQNRGPEVEMFQQAVDGHASAQAWCMSFVQYCLIQVGGTDLHVSSHCLTVWNKSPKHLRTNKPVPGCLMLWQKKGTSHGHVGIVVKTLDENRVVTIEGNTGPLSVVSRDGDGVYKKFRTVRPVMGNLEVVGFLKCWFKDE